MTKRSSEDQPYQVGAFGDVAAASPSELGMLDLPQSIAGVIGVVPGEVSPEEKARARQMLSALAQIQERFPRATGQNAETASQGHPDPTSDIAKPRRVKLDDILAPSLAEVGYKRVAKLTYRGAWSTPDVEHILSFQTHGVPKIYLSGDAGLRNPRASAFANQCRDRYATPLILRCLRESGYVYPPWSCPTHFDPGDLFGWKIRGQLNMSVYSASELARIVSEAVRAKLVPFVSDVVSTAAFLEFLDRNEEPVLWVRMGTCTQAAIVAYLATVLGLDRATTRAKLRQKAGLMFQWLDEPRITPESYIEHILNDAKVAVAAAAS